MEGVMDKKSFIITIFIVWGLGACDSVDQFNQPRNEQRTRIIAGQPAFDHDFKVVDHRQVKEKK